MVVVTGVELSFRRRRLGLTRRDLGVCLGLLSRGKGARAVAERKIARWENTPGPLDTMAPVGAALDRLDVLEDALRARIADGLRGASPDGDGVVVVPAYEDDASFWAAVPAMEGWPCALWGVGASLALEELRRDRPDVDWRMAFVEAPAVE